MVLHWQVGVGTLAAVVAMGLLPVRSAVVLLPNKSTVSCPHSCRAAEASATRPPQDHEVIGDSSRCFGTPGGGGWACLKVQCGIGSYQISSADGGSLHCGSGDQSARSGVSAICEHHADVCSPEGAVLKAAHEHRRTGVVAALANEFTGIGAQELMDHFDAGRFIPYTAEEHGLSNKQYVVSLVSKACKLDSWIDAVQRSDLEQIGMVVLKDVGEQELLAALRDQSGCLAYVEQDMRVWKTPLRSRAPLVTLQQAGNNRSRASPVTLQQVGLPWGLDYIDPEAGNNRFGPAYTGNGAHVYILDTGIDAQHTLLAGKVGQGVDMTGSGGTQDVDGHGTHCAGTVAGDQVGVAPNAKVYAVKVLGDDGSGSNAGVIAGVDYVVQQRRNLGRTVVASMSLGGGANTALNEAVASAVNNGVVVSVAAGNENVDGATKSPCSEIATICVGALQESPQSNYGAAPAGYSNYGNRVDIWAPGSRVLSAATGGGVRELSGTSMACPHVSGAAALLLEQDPSRSPAQVLQQLTTSCQNDVGTIKQSTGKILQASGGSCLQSSGGIFPDLPGGSLFSLTNLVLLCCGFGVCGLLGFFVVSRRTSGKSDERAVEMRGPPGRTSQQATRQTPFQPEAEPPKTGGGWGWGGGGFGSSGPTWEEFEEKAPKLAKVVEEISGMLSDDKLFAKKNSSAFSQLRIQVKALSKNPDVLNSVPNDSRTDVYKFIVAVVQKRKMAKGQGKEICKAVQPYWASGIDSELNYELSLVGVID